MACLLGGHVVMLLASPLPGRGGLFSSRNVHLTRRRGSFLAVKASKAGQPEGQGPPPPPYSDMLLQREYELWQRQSGLYNQLLQQHERERGHWEAERERWAAQEASLKQEVAELRAQLLYVLSRAGGAVPDARSSSSSTASGPFVPQQQEPASLSGRQQRQLPLGAQGLSPGEQVQAVIDAVKSGASLAEAPAGAGAASWPAEGGEAGSKAGGALPRYAAELAAAVAAVEELDVLSEEIDFGALADRLTKRGLAPGEAPAPAPAAAAAAAPAPAPLPAQTSSSTAPFAAPLAAAPPAVPAETQQDSGSPGVGPGPRPSLVTGSDDIYWMNELHRALVEAGFYPGDEDVEDFFFGEGTLSAVLTLQACEGLPETGVVDEATWEKLLAAAGEELGSTEGQPQAASAAVQASAGAGPASSPKPYQELFAQTLTSERSESPGGVVHAVHEVTVTDSVQSMPGGGIKETVSVREEAVVVASPGEVLTAWPVLMEGDGGKTVHALHVALEQNGCYPSDDDIRWWQFGDSTLAALKTFQACSGLPESGVADPATWRKLLGPDATPADLANLRSGDSADEDMAQEGRVWLMGEQRWEDPKRVKRQ